MASFSIIDYSIILLYLAFIITLGFRKSASKSSVDFLLGGRRLTLPAFVATLVSTWYGGILGVGEFSYLYGISSWLVFGVPYYLSAFFFGLFMAKRARREKVETVPHQLEKAYNRRTSLLGALFVFFMTSPAPYVLMLGVLVQYFTGWPLWICVSAGALFSMVYVLRGGFASVVRTDLLQFGLMFIGFIFILGFSMFQFGGWKFLQQSAPAEHFVWHGGNSAGYIIVWFFIALQTFVEPTFYQRCFAAKSENTARRGLFVSIGFWAIFDALTTFSGIYARAVLPELSDPVTSYLHLADAVLPPVIIGLFFAGLIATIMSTVDSYTFISGMTLGRDFIWRLSGKPQDWIQRYTRIGILITTLLSIGLAIYGKSVIQLWKELGSVATPALIFPVVSGYFVKGRMRAAFAVSAMLAGGISAFAWLMAGKLIGSTPWLGIEPIYPGLLAGLFVFLLDHLSRKN